MTFPKLGLVAGTVWSSSYWIQSDFRLLLYIAILSPNLVIPGQNCIGTESILGHERVYLCQYSVLTGLFGLGGGGLDHVKMLSIAVFRA